MSLGLAAVPQDRAWFPSLLRRGQGWLPDRLPPPRSPFLHPESFSKHLLMPPADAHPVTMKMREALWSAAACCRFCTASLLVSNIRHTTSKLAGKKAAASCRTPKRLRRNHFDRRSETPGRAASSESTWVLGPVEEMIVIPVVAPDGRGGHVRLPGSGFPVEARECRPRGDSRRS
jgi:hypothetical protein